MNKKNCMNNSKKDKSMFKMTPEELKVWLYLRGKGHSIDSKKTYKRVKNFTTYQ